MKYLIDLPGELVKDIRNLLNSGEYSSVAEFILTAIENQMSLEESVVTEEDLFYSTIRVPKKKKRSNKQKNLINFKDHLAIDNTDDVEIFEYPNKSELEYPDLSLNYDEYWLWGQINRIFPVKLAARILLKMQNEYNNFVKLKNFINHSSDIASKFGKQLSDINNTLNRRRDKKTDVALPIKGRRKSIKRFKNHFLIFQRKHDKILDGALARMKIANINENGIVRLTKAGKEFAQSWNPLIDGELSTEYTLSKDEKDLYIKHIKLRVPEERNPMLFMQKVINEGKKELKDIDDAIKNLRPEWSENVVVTQRAGALGRMYELDLVKKTKDGVNVKYSMKTKI